MTHQMQMRVYYEDTDMAGIVYYANYLKFIERARSTMVREVGVDQTKMKDEHGLVFAVRHVEADFLAPARLDDVLAVRSDILSMSGAKLMFQQDVFCDDKLLFSSTVTVACMTALGRPTRLLAEIRQKFEIFSEK